MKFLSKIFALIILLVSAVFFVSADNDKMLLVNFLDVGQGDAILIRTPDGRNILIDGGPGERVLAALDEELAWWDRSIDLMILTHPHDDHVAGLNAVLDLYDVGRVIYSGVSHTSPTYLSWLKKLRSLELPVSIIKDTQTILLAEGLKMEFIWPRTDLSGQPVNNLNNSSIVIKLVYNDISFLLTGDIEEEVEADLASSGLDLQAQVLKVGHHGSDTSSLEEFIDAVSPKYAIISVGENNSFGHPSLRVLRRFQRRNIPVLRTDQQGSIKFTTDGKTLGH